MSATGEWRDDPSGRHQYRWWDGASWTDQVADAGVTSTDPFEGSGAPMAMSQAVGTPSRRPKWPFALAAATFVVGLVLGIAIGAADDDNEPEVVGTLPPVEAVTDDDAGERLEDDDRSDTSASTSDVVPLGTVARVGEWEVAVRSTTLDANAIVAAENQFNDPPAPGRQFVIGELVVTYVGDGSGTPWVDLQIRFLGSGGNTFGSGFDDDCGVTPNELSDVGEMFPGASGEGNECVSVPVDQIEGGVWLVEESFSFNSTPVRFATT